MPSTSAAKMPETGSGTAKPFARPIGALKNGFARVQLPKPSSWFRSVSAQFHYGFGWFRFSPKPSVSVSVSDGFAWSDSNKISGFSIVSVIEKQIKTTRKCPFHAVF
jgi:hypothetical protein